MSRVVKGFLDGMFSDINGLREGERRFGGGAGFVKAGVGRGRRG